MRNMIVRVAVAALVMAALLAGAGRSAAAPLRLTDWAAEAAAGQPAGLTAAPGGLRLTGAPAAAAEEPFRYSGVFISAPRQLARPAATLTARWQAALPSDGALWVEVRGVLPGGAVTEWQAAPAAGGVARLPVAAAVAQVRLTLLAMAPDATADLDWLEIAPADGGSLGELRLFQTGPTATAGQPATFRLYATRIGLIGGRTSNGTIIQPEHQFVALPSRSVLASLNGREYQVRITHQGRSVTVPVWDTGPWNVRDNYWAAPAEREMWNDLPQGRPQAEAAYAEQYNAGRDGFGRRVLSPASIDISDGAFAALGMTEADWVEVSFLWLTEDGRPREVG
jgi:hypothetical protein